MLTHRFTSRPIALTLPLLALAAPLSAVPLESNLLPDTVGSDWWYGCVPTSVGIMMAYYDTNGYNGHSYDRLIPGGRATPGVGDYPNSKLLRDVIASEGHQRDFYSADIYGYNDGGDGYLDENDVWHMQNFGLRNDDLPTSRPFDCLADFMGTSQESSNCMNGDTPIYFNGTGERFYYTGGILDVPHYGQVIDMVYGTNAYVEYCGYSIAWAYTQNTDVHCLANNTGETGFTFDDYCAEIDAGRPMILNLYNPEYEHAIAAVGYDRTTESIYYYNTWDGDIHTLAWTGTLRDMTIDGVYAMELAPVPEPAALGLAAGLGSLLFSLQVRRRKAAARQSPTLPPHA